MIDVLQYSEGIDLQKIVDEQARKLQLRVDEAMLDKMAPTLANYGYVKADGKNRWFQLFGTPDRAARTLHSFCEDCFCGDCSTCGVPDWADYRHDYDALLEWLRSEV